jgi:hypothetical protein
MLALKILINLALLAGIIMVFALGILEEKEDNDA